jgi:SPP1 family predicted phage head-tail adaptor
MRMEFVDPGSFRHEFALETVTLSSDGAGGHGETWTEIARFLARLEPIAARSAFGAGQTLETVTHRVTLRHRPDVRSGMRLRRLDRILEIVTVHDPDETGRYLICNARETGA